VKKVFEFLLTLLYGILGTAIFSFILFLVWCYPAFRYFIFVMLVLFVTGSAARNLVGLLFSKKKGP
jgi:hypothetical protein